MSDIIGHRREGRFLTHFGKWFQKMQLSELPEIACSAAGGVRGGVQKNKNSSGDGPKTSFFASEIAGAAAPAIWEQITKISLYINTAEMHCFPKMASLSGFRCTPLYIFKCYGAIIDYKLIDNISITNHNNTGDYYTLQVQQSLSGGSGIIICSDVYNRILQYSGTFYYKAKWPLERVP